MEQRSKTVLVTGAAKGIGAAVARRFARDGAHVVLIDRDSVPGEATAAELRDAGYSAMFVPCDVASDQDIADLIVKTVGRFGTIDTLINCAGLDGGEATVLNFTHEHWDRVLNVNLRGTFFMTQSAARVMAKNGGGSIVNFASINAHASEPNSAAYCASKAGVLGLTRSAAVELGEFGIRVNSISPGYVDTPMVSAWFDDATLDMMRTSLARVPIGRLVNPDEIAAVCAFLASDDASAITGADIVVDGGTLANAYFMQTIG